MAGAMRWWKVQVWATMGRMAGRSAVVAGRMVGMSIRGDCSNCHGGTIMWILIARMIPMHTVQMTLDEKLVAAVDAAVKTLGTTRSAFTRDALRLALEQLREKELERRHSEGYRKKPVMKGEFDAWEAEQTWGDE